MAHTHLFSENTSSSNTDGRLHQQTALSSQLTQKCSVFSTFRSILSMQDYSISSMFIFIRQIAQL